MDLAVCIALAKEPIHEAALATSDHDACGVPCEHITFFAHLLIHMATFKWGMFPACLIVFSYGSVASFLGMRVMSIKTTAG